MKANSTPHWVLAKVACVSISTALACCPILAAPPSGPGSYIAIPAGQIQSVLSSADNAPVPVAAFAMRTEPVTTTEFLAFTAAHSQWQRGKTPAVFANVSYLRQLVGRDITKIGNAEPLTSVSWFAAEAFCESEGARLPTWHEWEYVAAADSTVPDARANPQWRATILAWYSQPSSNAPLATGGPANFYGVRDMHGLIWEWVEDFNALLVSADSRNQGDPDQLQYCGAGAISLQDRQNYAILMRVALLSSLQGADTTTHLGFRCARDQSKEPVPP
jgi:formylglycine-generating enzyme required for sulfatase activity